MDQPRSIRSFLLLAFGFTWSVAGIGAVAGIRATSGLPYMLLAALCMLGPAIAAVVQHRFLDRRSWTELGLHPREIDLRALAFTVLLAMCIVPMTLLVLAVFGDAFGGRFGHVAVTGERFVTVVQDQLAAAGGSDGSGVVAGALGNLPGGLILVAVLLAALFAAVTVNLPFMLGEELGWRGYLYQATAHWTAGRRVLFTGAVWGLWHAPLIMMGHNYAGYPILGAVAMVVFCMVLAVLFDRSRFRVRSVWGPCILHGMINGSAGAMAFFTWDGHVLFGSIAGVGGCVAIGLLAAVILLVDTEYRRSFFGGTASEAPAT